MNDVKDLPLLFHTPAEWAQRALADPLTLLNDHAHLERKAATNALALLNQWPDPDPPEEWVAVLTSVAKDEVEHLAIVTRLLARRGGQMSKLHRNRYASGLHRLVRLGQGKKELIDRLMLSALIELRSCERFLLLSEAAPDAELKKLYKSLWASEHGHYKVFLKLCDRVLPAKQVKARWQEMLAAEAELMRSLPPGSHMHSGPPA